jgi:radical SAM superfamily enzyme YgiQ (UPF0313 family)
MRIGFVYVRDPEDDTPIVELVFGYLKAYLHKHLSDSVEMIRADFENLHRCDVIAISTLSQDWNRAKDLAQYIKQQHPGMPIVIGGQHVTWLPGTLIPEIDFAVIGEGEQTFLELIQYFLNGRKEEDLFKINGLVFWKDGQLIAAPRRELIANLDDIPHPYREGITNNRHIFTSRGCPYKCTFCSSSAFWKKIRLNSSDWVVDEIERLVAIGSQHIPVMDDLFVANKKRFYEIIDKLKKRGLNKKSYFMTIQISVHEANDELLDLIKSFYPIQRIIFSAESGNDRILKLIGKGNTVAQNQAIVNKFHEKGVALGTSWIVGWPSETEEETRETCRWIMKNYHEGKFPVHASFNILMPLPGTRVWNDAVNSGLIDIATFDWNRLHIWAPQGNFISWEHWVNLRRKYNSIYLNESVVPQERLYEILDEEGVFTL